MDFVLFEKYKNFIKNKKKQKWNFLIEMGKRIFYITLLFKRSF